MTCKKCGSNKIKVGINLFLYVDYEDHCKITKKVLSKKSTELWAKFNEKDSFICKTCNFAWGYGYDYHAKDLIESKEK